MKSKKKVDRPRAGVLTKAVIVILLATIGWQIYDLRGQIANAEAEKERYTVQVEEMARENAALKADLAEGPTAKKLEDIARDELGYVKPGEYVFDPTNG